MSVIMRVNANWGRIDGRRVRQLFRIIFWIQLRIQVQIRAQQNGTGTNAIKWFTSKC